MGYFVPVPMDDFVTSDTGWILTDVYGWFFTQSQTMAAFLIMGLHTPIYHDLNIY